MASARRSRRKSVDHTLKVDAAVNYVDEMLVYAVHSTDPDWNLPPPAPYWFCRRATDEDGDDAALKNSGHKSPAPGATQAPEYLENLMKELDEEESMEVIEEAKRQKADAEKEISQVHYDSGAAGAKLPCAMADTELQVGENLFICHSAFVAAGLRGSALLRKLFMHANKKGLKKSVDLTEVLPQSLLYVFPSVLTYMYHGTLDHTKEHVVSLLVAAHVLRMPEYFRRLRTVITEMLDDERHNAIVMLADAQNLAQENDVKDILIAVINACKHILYADGISAGKTKSAKHKHRRRMSLMNVIARRKKSQQARAAASPRRRGSISSRELIQNTEKDAQKPSGSTPASVSSFGTWKQEQQQEQQQQRQRQREKEEEQEQEQEQEQEEGSMLGDGEYVEEIIVPDGYSGGETVIMQTRDGRRMSFTFPEDVEGGQLLHVVVPASDDD